MDSGAAGNERARERERELELKWGMGIKVEVGMEVGIGGACNVNNRNIVGSFGLRELMDEAMRGEGVKKVKKKECRV